MAEDFDRADAPCSSHHVDNITAFIEREFNPIQLGDPHRCFTTFQTRHAESQKGSRISARYVTQVLVEVGHIYVADMTRKTRQNFEIFGET